MLECYFRQSSATTERAGLYFANTRRNRHALDLTALEPLPSDFLNAFWKHHIFLSPEISEKYVSDHRFRWEYPHVIAATLLDVGRTAIFRPDYFETAAVAKRVFACFFERAGKRDFFDSTVSETKLSDVLHAIRNFKSFEIVAVVKCLVLESL